MAPWEPTGYADVTDPRGTYDDLVVDTKETYVDADAFAKTTDEEAFQSGWVAIGVVLDAADRVLLAYHETDGQWVLPGGTLQPGESLRDGLRREVREETGLEVKPRRPHAIWEHVVRHGDNRNGFCVAVLEAVPMTTEIGTDLGVDGEPILEADWFRSLPEDVYQREFAERALEQIRDSAQR